MEACKLVMKTHSVKEQGDEVIFHLSGTANSYRTCSRRDRDSDDLQPNHENNLKKLDRSLDKRGNRGESRTPAQKAGDERRANTWEYKWAVEEDKERRV